MRMNEGFGGKLSEKFSKNKLFWTEVNREGVGGVGLCLRIKRG